MQNLTNDKNIRQVVVETDKEKYDRLVKELNEHGRKMKYLKKEIHVLKSKI